MEDVQKEAAAAGAQITEAGEEGVAATEEDVATPDVAAEDFVDAEPEGVEVEVEQTLTRTQVIARLKAIVMELEGGSLVVDGVPVGELAESVDFELEYAEKDGEYELEIELKWQ